MRGKSTRTLLYLALFFFVILVINLTTVYRVQAQGVGDYFQLSYRIIGPSQTQVTGNQIFTVQVTGSAITKQNLPIAPSEARITGQIVAQNNSTGVEAILNPSYVVTIKPFPAKQGDTYSIDQTVNLQFPLGTPSGNYTIIGRLIEALVFVGPLSMPVTSLLPQTQSIGVVNYLASAPVAPAATPTITPAPMPTATPTVTPTATPTVTPVLTPTATPTVAPTATRTVTPVLTPTATPVVTPTLIPIPLQPSKALIVLIIGIVAVLAIISGVVIYLKRNHSK